MNVDRAWKDASAKLAADGVEDALMEGELLLRQTLEMERSEFYSGLGGELTTSELNRLKELLAQRLTRKPSAYIRHVKEFYGLEFYVDERALIPRPETELLVEKALEMVHSRLTLRQAQGGEGLLIADIGTGSGAIAVALAVNLPRSRIFATDISSEALEVAEINCRRHGVADSVQLLSGDLLTPLPQSVDIIIANLPYIPDAELDNLALEVSRYEPRLALSGGPDGLEYIRGFIDQGPAKLKPGGALLLEVGMGQAEVVSGMVHGYFPDVTVSSDLAGIPRVVVGKG